MKTRSDFFDKIIQSIEEKTLINLVLSKPRQKSAELRRCRIRLWTQKKELRLKFVYQNKTNDVTKHYAQAEALSILKQLMTGSFYNADLFTTTEHIQFLSSKKGKVKILTKPHKTEAAPLPAHDRPKKRIIETEHNIYLKELGILSSNWKVREKMTDKYKQINKYIELLAPVIKDLDIPNPFHIVDMGSGKGYLTFALYDYLTGQGYTPTMTGIEFRENLCTTCNVIAQKASFNQLSFRQGTIKDTKIEKIDILIALHACDTATDEAIYKGITSNAQLIVVAPCCHKQIRKAFHVTNVLKEILKFGILEERQAELITDGLRALIMEANGYKTKIVEFISSEHTPKNLMIIGAKQKRPSDSATVLHKIKAIKEMFGISAHHLEELLRK